MEKFNLAASLSQKRKRNREPPWNIVGDSSQIPIGTASPGDDYEFAWTACQEAGLVPGCRDPLDKPESRLAFVGLGRVAHLGHRVVIDNIEGKVMAACSQHAGVDNAGLKTALRDRAEPTEMIVRRTRQ